MKFTRTTHVHSYVYKHLHYWDLVMRIQLNKTKMVSNPNWIESLLELCYSFRLVHCYSGLKI